jgi:dihydrofolate synthase/folylpolyglutamate synthase
MRFDSLDGWLRWQERLHPVDVELGLERVGRVWRRLRPEGLGLPAVSLAGTNGKGSCAALLEAILGAAGYRTGCYTSPHLLRYNERIRLAGEPVGDADLCHAFERVDQARGGISLTYFELGTLTALDLFAGAGLDLAILEVGLGGRLDAVNLIDAQVALISSIGMDHQAWLGGDLEGIAREKAGIMRAGRPVVIGQADAPRALDAAGEALGATVLRAGRDFGHRLRAQGWSWWGPARTRHGLPRPALRAARQLDNAAAVLMVLDCLRGQFPVGQEAVRAGLQRVRLPGRLQRLPGRPEVVLDVAHNLPAMQGLARDLGDLPPVDPTAAVFACLGDKDPVGLVQALSPRVDQWHLAALEGPRALPLEVLAEAVETTGVGHPVRCYGSVAEAFQGARVAAGEQGRVVVTGSFLTVAAVMAHLGRDADPGLV